MTNARLRSGPAHAEAAVSNALQAGEREQRGTASRTSSPAGIFDTITKPGHGFSVGQGVGIVDFAWEALTRATYSFSSGVVVQVHSSDAFTVCVAGPAVLPQGVLDAYSVYCLDADTPGLLVPFVSSAEGVGDPQAVFFHSSRGRIWVMGPASNAHGHTLESLTDQAEDVHDDTGFGLNFLESGGGIPGERTFKFSTPGIGHNFGPGYLPSQMVDANGNVASAATWRETGQLWSQSINISAAMQVDFATNPQKYAIGFGPTHGFTVPDPDALGPWLWLDPTQPGQCCSVRPARGLDTAPVAFWNTSGGGTGRMLWFPLLSAVLFNRLRDLQDVEDLGGDNPTDGNALCWDEASNTYKHGTISTAGLADNAVTNAKLRDSAALSVIGNGTNATADPADITAGTDGYVLRRSGTALAFGQVATAGITDLAVTTAKIADLNVTGAKLEATGVTAGAYGASGASIVTLTVDAKGRVTVANDRTLTPANIGAVDTATYAAHTHGLGGDLSGTTSAAVVEKIQGKAWPASGAVIRDIPTFNGTAWVFTQILATAGDLFYRNGTQTGPLAIGSAGQSLIVSSGLPAWGAVDLAAAAAVTGLLPIAKGGTNASTFLAGLFNLHSFPIGNGTMINTHYTTPGAATHTWNASSKFALIVVVGGGGGGGGGSTASGVGVNNSAGGGGASGGIVFVFARITTASMSVTVGAAGTGGAAGADGTDGGTSLVGYSGSAAGGGGKGKNNGDGGSTLTDADVFWEANATNPNYTLKLPGVPGQPGRLHMMNYTAGSVIVSLLTKAGIGGKLAHSGDEGDGGDGGAAGAAGSNGVAGHVYVWEIR